MDEAQNQHETAVAGLARMHAVDLGFDQATLTAVLQARANIRKALEFIGYRQTDSGVGVGAADCGGDYGEFRVDVRISRRPS